eukprot:TRINITY_DN103302_c0_g1_i1.p1 TRINITY_DN103302_c0_g1~~TRINITY_DN103302_c0_g1_i1.p1  ORF type:complete len:192 (-),score=42.90 TRINITY_DN103302_c0_g1_i1:265-840(-)
MGCGASAGQKYQQQSDEVSTEELANLGDNKSAGSRYGPGISGGTAIHGKTAPSPTTADGCHLERDGHETPSMKAQRDLAARYRAGAEMQGVDEVVAVEGDAELADAMAAANDRNLLRKYADPNGGKARKYNGQRSHIFAPAKGPLSAEPLQLNSTRARDDDTTQATLPGSMDSEEIPLSNNTVGGLRLQVH